MKFNLCVLVLIALTFVGCESINLKTQEGGTLRYGRFLSDQTIENLEYGRETKDGNIIYFFINGKEDSVSTEAIKNVGTAVGSAVNTSIKGA